MPNFVLILFFTGAWRFISALDPLSPFRFYQCQGRALDESLGQVERQLDLNDLVLVPGIVVAVLVVVQTTTTTTTQNHHPLLFVLIEDLLLALQCVEDHQTLGLDLDLGLVPLIPVPVLEQEVALEAVIIIDAQVKSKDFWLR